LADGLDKNRFKIKVALGGDGELVQKLKEENIEIIKISDLKNSLNPLFLMKQVFKIRKILKKEKPEIFHINSNFASLAGSLSSMFLNIKVVYTAHG